MELIANFLDGEGRLKAWPSKRVKKLAALVYLGGKFVPGRRYTEREVNELLLSWHLFQDPATLRRELVEHGLLCRERDGSAYWAAENQLTLEDLQKLYG